MTRDARPCHRRWLVTGLALAVAATSVAIAEQDRSVVISAPGLVIEDVLADSAAARAGVKAGDRLLSYGAKPVTSPASLQAAEENTFDRREVVLEVARPDGTRTLTAPPGVLGLRTRPSLAPDAAALFEAGAAAERARDTDEAIAKWTAAARAAASHDAGAAAWLHGRVGDLHEGRRQWKEAREAHAAAWALLKDGSDAAAQSRTLVALGRCAQSTNDLPPARQWYEQATRIDEAAGYATWVARDLTNAGTIAFMRGDLAGAADSFARALGIRERVAPDSLDVAVSLNNLGVVTTSRGDLRAAEDHLVRALRIRERLAPDSLLVANSLNNLGHVYDQRGDVEEAHDHYNRTLAIQERLAPDSIAVATTLGNLGFIASARGDLAAAESYQRRSLGIRERLAPDSLEVAHSFNNLGSVLIARGDFDGGKAFYTRALLIRERLAPDSLDVGYSLNNLGWVAYNQRDYAAAHEYYTRALAIKERLAPDSMTTATCLNELGLVARARGELAAAQRYQARALAMRERLAPNSLAVAESLSDLALTARARGDLTVARDYHGRALALRQQIAPTSLDIVADLNGLGEVAVAERRFADALPLFTQAVDVIEGHRWRIQSTDARALLLAQHTEPYTGLLRTHVALENLPAALATAERARARSLLEILTEARAEIRQGVDPLLLDRERRLQQRLNAQANRQTQVLSQKHTDRKAADVATELDALLTEYREVQAQIRVQSPRYGSLTQPQPLGLSEIQQQLLDRDTVLLEYTLGEESSHLFVVSQTSIRAFELPRRATIDDAARRVYRLLVARQPVRGETPRQRRDRIDGADADYAAAAATLSEMVLGPAAGELSDKRLLIVADGALQYVPFAALPEPRIGDRQGAIAEAGVDAGQPLIVNHEVVSLPSASILAVMRQELGDRPPAERLVAVLADPVFDPEDSRIARARGRVEGGAASIPRDIATAARSAGLMNDRGSLSRLPFTRDEADAILALAPAGQATRAVDFTASRATAISADLSRYRVVHLATHGLLDAEHPELSGIVLSLVDEHGAPQDGFLRLHEVYNLNWSADLVVLSACQTALGKDIKGEGLVGLTRGFMYAGAERVLASLWNVNDGATAQFMKRFYDGLLAKRLTPAAALRAAQVEMSKRKAWRAPYYWAAFVLQGDWR